MLLDTSLLITVIAVMAFCAFIKGATGLGFSTLALALLVFFLPLKTAIALVIVPSLASNLLLMLSAGNFKVSIKQFFTLFLAAIPGMLLGLIALHYLDNSITSKLLAIVLLIYAVWGLWQERGAAEREKFSISGDRIGLLNPPIGFASGVVNGATGSQIIPIMPYLLALPISKEVFVQTINLSFTINSIVMLIALQRMTVFDTSQIGLLMLLILPVACFIWLGGRVRRHLSEQQFRRSVFVLLMVMGILILLR